MEKNKDKYRITSQNGIDEKMFVPINGQNQYIFIRGKDINNPVILSLHGGPANPDAFLTYEFAREICDDFTLVAWDQRGCGRTYYENKNTDPDNKTVTFEQSIKDVDELVNYLCKRFGKNKVIIMGHSYGTLLGINYVLAHPEKVEKYIGIGQSVSIIDSQTRNYQEVLEKMQQENKETDKIEKAYADFKKNLTVETLMSLQRLTMSYFVANAKDVKQTNELKLMLSSPDVSWKDVRWLLGMLNIKKHYARNKKLLDYALAADIRKAGNVFSVPMAFISGEYDRSCNVDLVKNYCENITAPSKEVVIMKNCGHSPQIDEPAMCAAEVKRLLQ